MTHEKLTFDIPGRWSHWRPLPEGLVCDECDNAFEVGKDVWMLEDGLGNVGHLCLDCAEQFIYQVQYSEPENLPLVAHRFSMVLYRPERDLTLDEIAALETATTILQEGGGRFIDAQMPTIH